MKKTKTKCYLYTRVSTSMQVDGYSLDAQRDKLRKYAEYEDMVVAGEYSDEGFSGKNIQGRHEFQRMLQDIQDCKDGVEYVLRLLEYYIQNEGLAKKKVTDECSEMEERGDPYEEN